MDIPIYQWFMLGVAIGSLLTAFVTWTSKQYLNDKPVSESSIDQPVDISQSIQRFAETTYGIALANYRLAIRNRTTREQYEYLSDQIDRFPTVFERCIHAKELLDLLLSGTLSFPRDLR